MPSPHSDGRLPFLAISSVLSLTLYALIRGGLFPATRPAPQPNLSSALLPSLGAVSSLSYLCTNIALDALKQGGNAIDAAIAAQFCNGVVAPQVTGLGAGAFALVRTPDGKHVFYDFRETAPAAASEDMFEDQHDKAGTGGLAVATPGELKGLWMMHERHALLPWEDLLQPSIDLCLNGHPMDPNLWSAFAQNTEKINDAAFKIDYAPHGFLVAVNETVTQRRYGALLEEIASRGPDAFYSGVHAQSTIDAVKARGGIMKMHDLSDYKVEVREPLQLDYNGHRIFTCGSPGGGTTVLAALNILGAFKEQNNDTNELDPIWYHRLIEATRFAHGLRTELGDPAFVPESDMFDHWGLDQGHVEEIKSKISDDHTLPVESYSPQGYANVPNHGTSHLSVAAAIDGSAVSLTSTLNGVFGSGIMVPETGVTLNNEMADFAIPDQDRNLWGYKPAPANYIAPGKRPLSAMSPTIVERLVEHSKSQDVQSPAAVIAYVMGAAGGSKIITAVIQLLWQTIDRNMTIVEAQNAPRWHDQLIPNILELTKGFDSKIAAFLVQRGHNVSINEDPNDTFTWNQIVGRTPNGTFVAVAQPGMSAAAGTAL